MFFYRLVFRDSRMPILANPPRPARRDFLVRLPIPDFKQAVMSDEFIRLSARDDIADLGAGVGFASQLIPNTDELTYLYIGQIDEALRAKILLFDWWTANGDRTLAEHGGNPNILWVHPRIKMRETQREAIPARASRGHSALV